MFFCRMEYRYIIDEIPGNMLCNQSYVIMENIIMAKNKIIKEILCNVVLGFLSLYQNSIFLTRANIIIEHQLNADNNKNQSASETQLMVLNINIFFLVFTRYVNSKNT